MTMLETTYEHIVTDNQGVAWIEQANIKVIELVVERQAYGESAEELQRQHPTLTLGQIYSALAYYEDHKRDLDNEIEQRRARVAQIQQQTPVPDVVNRLRTIKYGAKS